MLLKGYYMKNINDYPLPQIFLKNGKECYLDPIRKKLIYITPEETVRQHIISYLQKELKVPAPAIDVEQHLSHYGISTKRRADIVIHKTNEEGDLFPIAIIECKAPDVSLDEKSREQVLDYCDLTGADYALITNGVEQICFKYDDVKKQYIPIEDIPVYQDILSDKYNELDIGELPKRIEFNKLEQYLQEDFDSYEDDYYGQDISKLTPMNLSVATFNLWEGLLDTRIKMPVGDYGIFKLIEDYGVRMLSYGNASGGKFFGPYRSFLVDIKGSTEFFSIGVTTYCRSGKQDTVKTCIVVAHDDEKNAHHSLQLVVDDNLIMIGNKINFYHHGKIAIGNLGSGKIGELRQFVDERYPKIISGNKFFLGSLVNDRLWQLDDPAVINVIVNLISYSIIRDEYREYVKQRK